jgi:eukaryotic-like serine/threonine-protein kinase
MPRDGDDFGDELSDAISANVQRNIRERLGVPQLPQGTVTVMFTDVEGSSELVRELGDRRARHILQRHDDVVRGAIQTHGGKEVERAGDSFMVAFTTARQALACAMEIQRALVVARQDHADEAVDVRIGMDTGEVLAEEARYFGSTVFRAARIADLAPGGRIFVSEATKVLGSQAGYLFDDLGDHELKGLGPGHRLFEVISGPAEGVPA